MKGARVDTFRVIRILGISLVALYAATCLLARLTYRKLLYPAPQVDIVPPPANARIVELRAADGVPVHAMAFETPGAMRTIVYFHGNGEVIGDDVWMADAFVARGFAATLVEYRGYGRSIGAQPTEQGLFADASAVLDDLAARGIGPDRVILWGASLGSGVAVEMARRGRGAALVLVAPYTSIVDMAKHFAPFLPAQWLIGDRFDSLAAAPSLHLPTVVVHGTDDEVIPFAMGERIAAAIPGARFERVAGGRHMDCFLVETSLLSRVTTLVSLASNASN